MENQYYKNINLFKLKNSITTYDTIQSFFLYMDAYDGLTFQLSQKNPKWSPKYFSKRSKSMEKHIAFFEKNYRKILEKLTATVEKRFKPWPTREEKVYFMPDFHGKKVLSFCEPATLNLNIYEGTKTKNTFLRAFLRLFHELLHNNVGTVPIGYWKQLNKEKHPLAVESHILVYAIMKDVLTKKDYDVHVKRFFDKTHICTNT